MATRECRNRNSLLSRLRGSFVPFMREFLHNGAGRILVCEENKYRIYLSVAIDTASTLLFLHLDDSSGQAGFVLSGNAKPQQEFTIETHPGLVQCELYCTTDGMPCNVKVTELISGG